MHSMRICAASLAGVFIFGSSLGRTQEPQRTTATYDDWTVSCEKPAQREKLCEVVHTQTIQGQPNPVGQIVVRRPSKNEPFKILLQVPPNVWLQTGVKF